MLDVIDVVSGMTLYTHYHTVYSVASGALGHLVAIAIPQAVVLLCVHVWCDQYMLPRACVRGRG